MWFHTSSELPHSGMGSERTYVLDRLDSALVIIFVSLARSLKSLASNGDISMPDAKSGSSGSTESKVKDEGNSTLGNKVDTFMEIGDGGGGQIGCLVLALCNITSTISAASRYSLSSKKALDRNKMTENSS